MGDVWPNFSLGPADFVEPLLVSLGEVSFWEAGKVCNCRDVYKTTMDLTGVHERDYGIMESASRPYVTKWIERAFNRHLRARGLAESKGRGQWTLTAKGIKLARQLQETKGKAGFSLAEAVKRDFPQKVQTSEPSVPISLETVAQARVGAQQSKCFGYFSSDASECSECLLASRCEEASVRVKEKLARELKNQSRTLPSEVRSIAAWAPTCCVECSKMIPRGSESVWIPGVGLYHTVCLSD